MERTLLTWTTVKVGIGPKVWAEFYEALKVAGIKIGARGNDILSQTTFATADTEETLEMVSISAKELGFQNGGTTTEIYAKAQLLGLSRSSAEVAPQLWLQNPNLLPKDDSFLVAMEPITDSGGYSSIFSLGCDDNHRWLNASDGQPDCRWFNRSQWIFSRCR